jgi:hypothetical protein
MPNYAFPLRALPLAIALAGPFTAGTLSGQGVPVLDSTVLTPVTASGKFLAFWAAEEGTNGEQAIYFKNLSPDRSITITTWEIYDCIRLAGGVCGKRDKGPTIKPGKTVRLILIRGSRGGTEGFSYRYRFTHQWTDELTPPP